MKKLILTILTRFAFCLAALLPARAARADDDNDIKVNVVVDLTDAGRKIPRPTPGHPAYFYPVTRGYTLGEGVVPGEKPPPAIPEVQHLIAVALAQQGYLLSNKQSPPSLLLMFWWGYKAPVFEGPTTGGAASRNEGNDTSPKSSLGALGAVAESLESGEMGTNTMTNDAEMEDLIFGSSYDRDSLQHSPSVRLQMLGDEARTARYYVTVSALDFAVATQQKKLVVLWTARMSTDLYGHTLDQVLPSLITAGAPMFGKDTQGALWPLPTVPLVPMGHVVVGTPYVKTYPVTPGAGKTTP